MRGLNFEEFTEAVEHGVRQYLEDAKGYSATVDASIESTDVSPHEEFFEDGPADDE